jgi:hypothetical protein
MRALLILILCPAATAPTVLPTPEANGALLVYTECDMPDNTVTLALDGDVTLEEFAEAIAGFNELVTGLCEESGTKVEWIIDDLQYSSTIVTGRGIGEPASVRKVVSDFADVGRAIENHAPFRHTRRVRHGLRRIFSRQQHSRSRTVRFETAESESVIPVETVNIPPDALEEPQSKEQKVAQVLLEPDAAPISVVGTGGEVRRIAVSYGAVTGRIQTLSTRGGLRFTLFDLLNDKAVSCYLKEGDEEKIRNLWGRLAVVEGFVSRDPSSGRAFAIRQVDNITPLMEPSGPCDYQAARGVAPSLNGLSPEEAIRRVRDVH